MRVKTKQNKLYCLNGPFEYPPLLSSKSGGEDPVETSLIVCRASAKEEWKEAQFFALWFLQRLPVSCMRRVLVWIFILLPSSILPRPIAKWRRAFGDGRISPALLQSRSTLAAGGCWLLARLPSFTLADPSF
jgi:hypothetical protein